MACMGQIELRVCSRSRLMDIDHSNMGQVGRSRSETSLTSAHAGISCDSFYTPVAAVQQGLRIVETHSHQKLSGRYRDHRSRCLWPRPCDTGFIPHRRVRKFRSIPQKSEWYGFISFHTIVFRMGSGINNEPVLIGQKFKHR